MLFRSPWSSAAALSVLARSVRLAPTQLPLLRDAAAAVIADADPGARQPRQAAHRCLALAEAFSALRAAKETGDA